MTAEQRMMETSVKELDAVAITQDLPDAGHVRGQVSTVVKELAPGVFEVESVDNDGRTCSTASSRQDQLIVLHYAPVAA